VALDAFPLPMLGASSIPLAIVTDRNYAAGSSVGDAIGAMDHGHDGGIAEAGWNIRQLRGAELARAKFANVFIGVRVLGTPAPVRLDRLVDCHCGRFWTPNDHCCAR
jgi:hypothetical protein